MQRIFWGVIVVLSFVWGTSLLVKAQVACPSQPVMGNLTINNGLASATFDVARGCSNIPVRLVSTVPAMDGSALTLSSVSNNYNAGGQFQLQVPVPVCYDLTLSSGPTVLQRLKGGCEPLVGSSAGGLFLSQRKGQEYRVVLRADSWQTWLSLAKIYGLDPNAVDEVVN